MDMDECCGLHKCSLQARQGSAPSSMLNYRPKDQVYKVIYIKIIDQEQMQGASSYERQCNASVKQY